MVNFFLILTISILDLSLYSDFDEYLKSIRSVRRQEYNKCIRDEKQIEIPQILNYWINCMK